MTRRRPKPALRAAIPRIDAAAIRRAQQQMQRSREAILRGDTFRIGGRRDAPTDCRGDAERHQDREYIRRRRK